MFFFRYSLRLFCDEIEIVGSPCAVELEPAESDPLNIRLDGPGLHEAICETASEFHITTYPRTPEHTHSCTYASCMWGAQRYDRFSNQRKTGGEKFEVSIEGHTMVMAYVRDLGSGMYATTHAHMCTHTCTHICTHTSAAGMFVNCVMAGMLVRYCCLTRYVVNYVPKEAGMYDIYVRLRGVDLPIWYIMAYVVMAARR